MFDDGRALENLRFYALIPHGRQKKIPLYVESAVQYVFLARKIPAMWGK